MLSRNCFALSAKDKLKAKKESRFLDLNENNLKDNQDNFIRNIGTIAHIGKLYNLILNLKMLEKLH